LSVVGLNILLLNCFLKKTKLSKTKNLGTQSSLSNTAGTAFAYVWILSSVSFGNYDNNAVPSVP
jgi:hypothetical protein